MYVYFCISAVNSKSIKDPMNRDKTYNECVQQDYLKTKKQNHLYQ